MFQHAIGVESNHMNYVRFQHHFQVEFVLQKF